MHVQHDTGSCSRCDGLPAPATAPGRLYLWPPLDHTAEKIAEAMGRLDLDVEAIPVAGCLAVGLSEQTLENAALALEAAVTPLEARDTRVLFHVGVGEPTLQAFALVKSLQEWCAHQQGRWLLRILAEGRLSNVFQPIVHADRLDRVFAQECLMRAVDSNGATVMPSRILAVAREAGLLFHLDRQARIGAVASAARHGITENLFINFTPTSLYDPANCLRTTLDAVDTCGFARDRVVFEVIETEHIEDSAHLRRVLDVYRAEGFRVALDDLGAGYSSLNLLSALRPDFVKIDRELIAGIDSDPFRELIVSRLIGLARDLGVEVIAEGVETPGELAWLQRLGAHYVQGYLIARPASPPPRPAAGLAVEGSAALPAGP